ncbi:2-dehydro-3-deoxygluconokinase [Gracilibacillus ureilyticus]|uniref:2-dehydro-3-deoxygluconokinase n=1 Tax=Gracilibacillus ureilyticus TaxID=531814 RepID=A0A1H9T1P9_9BACI|nr:sugar kinase [Gracilibacillus ureilyticus]SER90639.1 2-dehydro-3-deoxygluconokinase [Gracilibacillus ureilyticus]
MDVVTLGESMILLTPQSNGLMRYAATFSRKIGGAESNVAIGLARLGYQTGWISKVGDDEFGRATTSFIRGEGVDVSYVKTDNNAPTGIYFKELRNSSDVRVQYYRKGSAASMIEKEDISEEYISQAKFLHITGITPALSDNCYEAVMEAISLAKKNKVKIIFDPNLRMKLWQDKEKACQVILHIASQSDIVLPGLSEAAFLFGDKEPDGYAADFFQTGSDMVILKAGKEGTHYFTKEDSGFVKSFPVEHVVDPVGAGDGFAAGFISGLLDGLELKEAVKRGNAVGAMVTMVNGDVEGLPEKEEIERFIKPEKEDVSR